MQYLGGKSRIARPISQIINAYVGGAILCAIRAVKAEYRSR